MNTDFGNSTSSLVGFILRNSTLEAEGVPSSWTTLPSGTTNGAVFGGFIGYNMQWDQLAFAAGLGVDWAATPNVFVRGEWEFVAFAPVNQTRTNIQVGHVGAGVRF